MLDQSRLAPGYGSESQLEGIVGKELLQQSLVVRLAFGGVPMSQNSSENDVSASALLEDHAWWTKLTP